MCWYMLGVMKFWGNMVHGYAVVHARCHEVPWGCGPWVFCGVVHARCHGVLWEHGPWVCCGVIYAGCHGAPWERGPWVYWWFLINLTQARDEKKSFLIFFSNLITVSPPSLSPDLCCPLSSTPLPSYSEKNRPPMDISLVEQVAERLSISSSTKAL